MTFSDPGAVPDVATADPIDPDWGNAIRNRVVHHFASAAARDSALVAPTGGMACWLADVGQFLVYNGVAWRKPWSEPWGYVASAACTGTASITSVVDLTGATVTFTAVANRWLELQAHVQINDNSSADRLQLFIADGANAILGQSVKTSDGQATQFMSVSVPYSPAAGSVTVKLRSLRVSGAGTYSVTAPTAPQWAGITVKDIGPNGAPA